MDLRIQKTKNSIFSAFIELRAAKPLEKITSLLVSTPQPDCSVPHLSHRDICSTFFSRMMTEAAACSPTNWKPALRN